jgi:hypothetical protein
MEINNNTLGFPEKLQRITEKLSTIHSTAREGSVHNKEKLTKLEFNVEKLEGMLEASVSGLELKYITLKEHITKLRLANEEEKRTLEGFKTKLKDDFITLEENVRNALSEEAERHRNNTESIVRKLEGEFYRYDKDSRVENDKIKQSIKDLESYLDVNQLNDRSIYQQ